MKLIFFGDIVGEIGRDAVKETLPIWEKEYKPDLIIANAENAANGALAQPKHLDELLAAGVDAFTIGDHIRDREFRTLNDYPAVRPINLTEKHPGVGYRLVETPTHQRLALASIVGNAFIKTVSDNYFQAAEQIVKRIKDDGADASLIDFHAEVTSEKNSLGRELDGRVSAVVGTHTHVPTADTRLLPKGTAYQTDVGMCGGYDSVIGFSPPSARKWLGRELGEGDGRVPFEIAGGVRVCDAVLIETAGPGKSKSITRLTTRPQA
jgi:metallophosphoesterase (TIGR00282 family)